MQIYNRPRRNRKDSNIRLLIQENIVTVNDLIAPLFFIEGNDDQIAIDSMPGQYRFTIDRLVKKVKELEELGIKCVSLFPAVEESLKTSDANEALNPDGLNQRAVRAVKEACPDMTVMTDIALDPYSSDGHDGLVDKETGEILNDETLEILAQMAITQAKAGTDIVGPSDMMDCRVAMIRKALDGEGFKNVSIMSYTAKYASSFYGPFRDALDSAPKAGDKKTYQMDFANSQEALRELALDEQEGADIVMVKPGLAYLDIIAKLKANTHLPVAAYNVSGEYAMVKAAAQKGWLDDQAIMVEMLTSFKRAGADIVLTYFAEEMAKALRNI
jgi:porphobilinogen synthase